MFRTKTTTKYHRIEKFFVWEIENLCDFKHDEIFASQKMTAIGFDNIVYTGTFRIFQRNYQGTRGFSVDIHPLPDECVYFWQDDINGTVRNSNSFYNRNKVTLWIDLIKVESVVTTTPALEVEKPKKTAFELLSEMWSNDESAKFIISCGNQDYTAIKPIMCAHSIVFKKMFETNMKEKDENRVEITDFNSQVVRKMIEFCEKDTISYVEKCEEDLFKIAHKYEIESLKEFAIEAMAKSTTHDNVDARLQFAQFYELKDFEKWCKNFQQVPH